MSYKITVSKNGMHIRVRVDEAMTRVLAVEIAGKLAALSAERGIKNFLYDVRNAPNIESIVDNYTFAQEDMAEMGLDRGANAAILTREGDTSHDFVETAMRNAGYDTRLFTNERAAIAWLEQPEPE